MPVQVAIVEDNASMCEELQHVVAQTPNLACVCVCRNVESALRRIPPLRPDVIIMDIQLPDGSGVDCTSRLKRLLPETQILMFTIKDDPDSVVGALEAGASGYLLKGSEISAIGSAIHDVVTQGAPLSREVARKLVERFHKPAGRAAEEMLTPREEEILSLIGKGMLNKEVADRLSISFDTVSSHLKNIYRKLHVHTRTEAVMKYRR